MKEDTYRHCIQTLEEGFNWKLPNGALKIWWDVLTEEKFTDEDFEDGCIFVIRNLKRFPSLNELIEATAEIRKDRLEREWQAKKSEENKYRHLTQEEILARGARGNPKTRERITITRRLLKGEIDKATWERLMKGE